jgi:isocitrate lyase
MFNLAYGYARNNMSAFVELQQKPNSPPPTVASPP